MPKPTGIFTPDEAKPENYPHSDVLAHKLSRLFTTDKMVLDFGAGNCFYIKKLFKHGFNVWGIDGYFPTHMHAELFDLLSESNFNLHVQDLSKKFEFWYSPEPYKQIFQIGQVLCLEVGEHIPAKYESVFLDNLARHCNSRMVLSWAVPGQNGIGHVNCRPNEWVLEQMIKRGFTFNEHQTTYLRCNIEQHVAYFAQTLMVFDKIND
jgi:hypothetical protein